jgi:hypothetical protein
MASMAEGEWTPVHGGWMQAPDPDEPDVDYFEADRVPRVRRRAAVLDQAAALAADEAFTAGEVNDMWQRSGLTGDELDAAAHVALTLAEAERYGWLGED